MKRATDLYPMRVNPFNFQRGDVVKKIYTDKVTTPYVGVVTAIVPSTNKIEVQWPHSMGIEDPWDLIKVNPLLNPPVVNEDKSYKTYQNELSHKYFEKLQPNTIVKQFMNDEQRPILLRASDLYNQNINKKQAYFKLSSEFDNKWMITEALNRVYNDPINVEANINDHGKEIKITLSGNSDKGYSITTSLGDSKKIYAYETYIDAVKSFNKFKRTAHKELDHDMLNVDIIKKASKKMEEAKKEASEILDLGGSVKLAKEILDEKYPGTSSLILSKE